MLPTLVNGLNNMGGFRQYRCNTCSLEFTEYYHIPQDTNDDIEWQSNERFCITCKKLTTCRFRTRESLDPVLYGLLSGNKGRILDFLYKNSILLFDDWTSETGLPSPKKLKRIASPLAEIGLIKIDTSSILITEQAMERMKLIYKTTPCSQCGNEYCEMSDITCPICEKGNIKMLSVGYCSRS